MAQLRDHAPGFDGFVRIGRTQGDQAGDGAQGRKMFDWLMRWSIFADADRIVREDVDHRDFHEGAQADGRAAVVAENEEPRSEGSKLRQREAIEDGAHGVLTNAKVEIPSGRNLRAEITGTVERQTGFARRPAIRRTAGN